MSTLFLLGRTNAFVAQLVEQRTENPRVVGSIPTEGTICGFSSFGRAPPCQGGGSEFEPRNPLQRIHPILGGFFKSSFHFKNTASCGFSSFGRAPPCQGGGSEFEPRNPLQVLFEAVVFLKCGFSSSGRAPPSQGGCGEFESRNPLQSQKSLQRGFWLFPFYKNHPCQVSRQLL